MGRSIFGKVMGGVVAIMLTACGGPGAIEEKPDAQAVPVDSFATALADVDQRIVGDPANATLYAERSRLYETRDSLNKAILDMERAVRLDSLNADHRIRVGDLYFRAIRMGNARDAFQRAVDIAPQDTRAKLRLAEVLMVLRDYPKSMTLVNEALRLEPTTARGYYLKGYIHMETRDTVRAISSFRTAVEQDPEDFPSYVLLGKLSAARHDPLAEQYYSTAIDLRPMAVEAWYGKGLWAQDNGRDSLALACYDRIKEIDPRNALAWHNSGWIKMEHLGDPQGAKSDFSRAIDLNTNYADAWYNRGVAMERTHELDSAAANYQLCMGIDPSHTLAANAIDRLARQGVRIKMRERKKK
jgi:tetratricopeptide (TPR) repeat protein